MRRTVPRLESAGQQVPRGCALLGAALSCADTATLGSASAWSASFAVLQRRIRATTDREELCQWLRKHVEEVTAVVRAMEEAVAAGDGTGIGPAGLTFKPSVSRKTPSLAFFPINLHVQEMRVRPVGAAKAFRVSDGANNADAAHLLGSPHSFVPGTQAAIWASQAQPAAWTSAHHSSRGSLLDSAGFGAPHGGADRQADTRLSPHRVAQPADGEGRDALAGSPGVGEAHAQEASPAARGQGGVWSFQEVIYDTVTVGAFAAHTLGFGKGGLRRTLQQLRSRTRSLEAVVAGLPSGESVSLRERRRIESSVRAWRSSRAGSFGLNFLLPTGSADEAALNHAAMDAAQARWRCEQRADVVLPQALAALATAFSRKLRLLQRHMRPADGRRLLRQYASSGFLFAVESLLSASGHEWAMIEDFEAAVAMLKAFKIRLLPPEPHEAAAAAGAAAAGAAGGDGMGSDAMADIGAPPGDWRAGGGGSVRVSWEASGQRPAGPPELGPGCSGGCFVLEIRMWPGADGSASDAAGHDEDASSGDGGGDEESDEESDEASHDEGVAGAALGAAAEVARGGHGQAWRGWPRALRRLVPARLRGGGCIDVWPVLFTQGVNELQTLANLQESISLGMAGEASAMQRRINATSLKLLQGYVAKWQSRYTRETGRVQEAAATLRHVALSGLATAAATAEAADPRRRLEEATLPAGAGTRPYSEALVEAATGLSEKESYAMLEGAAAMEEEARGRTLKVRAIARALHRLDRANAKSAATKSVQILTLASSVARSVHGARVTCCKSAKDRTSMLVTLEQESLLTAVHGPLRRTTRSRVREVMRRYGVRLQNALKNTGKMRFAFNAAQMLFLPAQLRPPEGTGGSNAT